MWLVPVNRHQVSRNKKNYFTCSSVEERLGNCSVAYCVYCTINICSRLLCFMKVYLYFYCKISYDPWTRQAFYMSLKIDFDVRAGFMALTYHQHRNSTVQIWQRKLPLRQRWQHTHTRYRVTPVHASALHHRSTSSSVGGVWPVDLRFRRSASRCEDDWGYVRFSMTATRFLVTVTVVVTSICATGDMVLTILQWVAL